MSRKSSRALLIVLSLVFALAIATPALAHNKGCTPGFYKNHPEAWIGYSPDQTIGSVFSSAPAPFDTESLIDGLDGGGGDDLTGKLTIMFRAAIAGLLNRDYPATKFINRVNAKVMTGDLNIIVAFADKIDKQNNADCTLD